MLTSFHHSELNDLNVLSIGVFLTILMINNGIL